MGKASKIRKRRKIESSNNGIGFVSIKGGTSDSDSEVSGNETEGTYELLVPVAISVLQYLWRRIDRYEDKSCKALRVSIFPLIELQKSKFFEEPMKQAHLTDDEFERVVTPKTLESTIRVAQHFVNNLALFNEEESKPFRRVLHPLVVHTFKLRTVGNKTNAAILRQGDQCSALATLSVSTISNRISNCFRNKDYSGALSFLHQITNNSESDDSLVPKLGSLQRWVRDCDLINPTIDESCNSGTTAQTSILGTVDVKEMSLLLLHGVLRVTNIVKQKHAQLPVTVLSRQPTKLQADNKNMYPYSRAEKILYPSFSSPKPWPSGAYFSEDRLQGLIASASRDYRSNSERITGPNRTRTIDASSLEAYKTRSEPTAEEFYQRVSVVSHVPGPLRRPPAPHDLNIFVTSPGTICYSTASEEVTRISPTSEAISDVITTRPSPERHDVPHVPGAMLLTGILTPLECAQFIVAAERLGYTPDAVDGIDNVVWLADDALLSPIYERVQNLLPPTLEGHQLCGVNARLRLFRYYPGAEYRPHIDGAWPGSGLQADGSYTDDAFGADRHSRLTFLIYLNDGFTGGATTFFLPGPDAGTSEDANGMVDQSSTHVDAEVVQAKEDGVGYIEVRKVEPQLGAVLVFPHGSASGSLVHEGSAVTQGVKYVIRTDVLYTSKPVAPSADVPLK